MDIKIRIVGRKNGSEAWLEDAYSMYDTRLRPSPIDVVSSDKSDDFGCASTVVPSHEIDSFIIIVLTIINTKVEIIEEEIKRGLGLLSTSSERQTSLNCCVPLSTWQ